MERTAAIERKTRETDIALRLGLEAFYGENSLDSGVPFLDHMLDAFSRHGHFSLSVRVKGDLEIDDHHTMEDLGLALGQALRNALGSKRGVTRFGAALVPLDESLARAVVDLSGRPHLSWRCVFPESAVGGSGVRLYREFFQALVNTSGITLHVDLLACEENHHGMEAVFKAFGRALRQAVDLDPAAGGAVPSTKGVLE